METKDNKETYNGRSYYGGMDCIDAMVRAFGAEAVADFCKCNAFKYLWRADKKHDSPLEDLRKAGWYINKAVELIGDFEAIRENFDALKREKDGECVCSPRSQEVECR